jgi:lipopolysaccharide/colanic/teichoic acid biosynthesis glycosyltransferase
MSLVGPRPEVPEYTASYTDRQRQTFRVKPGITGPAANDYIDEEDLLADQVDKETFYLQTILPAKLEYDIAYCGEVRFRKDLLILLKTFTKVSHRFVGAGKPRLLCNRSVSKRTKG